MPTRIFSTFGTYDFLGKSIPGLVATVLFASLLPYDWIVWFFNADNGLRFSETLGALFVLFIVGFIVGQGLHTISVLTERTALWATLLIVDIVRSAAGLFISITGVDRESITQFVPDRILGLFDNQVNGPRWRTWEEQNRWVRNTLDWVFDRWVDIKRIFVPHRVIFHQKLLGNWDHYPPCRLRSKFREASNFRFDESFTQVRDVDEHTAHQYKELYQLVMSVIDAERGDSRSGRFQASYTFCRSIWVTLLLFMGSVYVLVERLDFTPFTHVYPFDEFFIVLSEPYILQILDVGPDYTFYSGITTVALLFMYASGTYKEIFVEYVITDFINATNVGFQR